MMTTMVPELLSAYVDQELSAAAAADVAAAVAGDPSLAARVATLAKLRAAVRGLAPPVDVPAMRAAAPRRLLSHWRPAALAASLLAALALGASFFGPRVTGEAADMASAIAANKAWLAGDGGNSQVRLAFDAATGGKLPDLSSAGLRLVYISALPGRDRASILAGYRGPHGCQLALWMGPAHGPQTPNPAATDQNDLLIRAWTTASASYALLSRSMDPLRLDHFASVIQALVTQGDDMTDEQRVALLAASRAGTACQA